MNLAEDARGLLARLGQEGAAEALAELVVRSCEGARPLELAGLSAEILQAGGVYPALHGAGGLLLERMGRLREARQAYEQALEQANDPRIGLWLARVRRELAEMPAALALLEELELRGGLEDDLRLEKAEWLLENGQPGRAAETLSASGAGRGEGRRLCLLSLATLAEEKAEEARQHANAALRADRALLGEEHPDLARDLCALSGAETALGRPREALGSAEDALRRDRELFGGQHPVTARSLATLGEAQAGAGMLREAAGSLQQALHIFTESHGRYHPLVAALWNNLGHVQQQMGLLDEALSSFNQASVIFQKTRGANHLDTGLVYGNMGAILQMQGKLLAARMSLDHAVRVCEGALGRTHPTVAVLVQHLGEVLRQSGDLAGAEQAARRALEMGLAGEGDGAVLAERYANLGRVQQARKDYGGARESLEQALRLEETRSGKGSPPTAARLNSLGLLCREEGRREEARELLGRALEAALRAEDPPVTETANIETNLGVVLLELGEREEASRLLAAAEAREMALYGADDLRVAGRLSVHGPRWEQLGETGRALAAYRQAEAVFRQHLPPHHPRLASLRQALARLGAQAD